MLTAVLDAMRRETPRRRLEWAYNQTSTRCSWHPECGDVAIPALLESGTIDSSLVSDFTAKTAESVDINAAFFQKSRLRVVTPEMIRYYADEWMTDGAARGDAEQTEKAFWAAFQKQNGKRAAILGVTRPAFSAEGTQALVEVRADSTARDDWRRLSRMMLLTKAERSWKVSITDVGKLQRSGRWSGNRCAPAIIERESVTKHAVAELVGDFLVTIVPATGRNGVRRARMRLSRKPRDPIAFLNPKRTYERPVPKGLAHPLPVFEIVDETGKLDDDAALSFFLEGAGQEIERRSSVMILDGFSQSLVIRELDTSGFSGIYAAGVYGPTEFGVFCAARIPPPVR